MADTHSTLYVLISGTICGRIEQRSNGHLRFTYDDEYAGPPLSLTMPVGGGPYGEHEVRPFVLGLLPDTPKQRRAIGHEFGVHHDNPLELLRNIGWDCPGAVQFSQPEKLENLLTRAEEYVPTTPEEIGATLAGLVRDDNRPWPAADEHWSLGGAQTKIARALFGGTWYRCEGAAATTHIIKPGARWLEHHALNEAVCLTLASLCGVSASRVEYRKFDGEPAIVCERYDRVISDMGITRLHQEDFCQASSVHPNQKYPWDNGPGAQDILRVLKSQPNAEANSYAFTVELFFNYLIGGTDAHAKNYSVLLTENGPIMAPLYDCASYMPYIHDNVHNHELPMAIGGKKRFGMVGSSAIRRYAVAAGLDDDLCIQLMANLAHRVNEHVDEAFDIMQGEQGEYSSDVEDLRKRLGMARRIRKICESTLERLSD